MFYRICICLCAAVFLNACGGSGSSKTPDMPVLDTTPPTITLNGEADLIIEAGSAYQEQGANAIDNIDGEVEVIISGSVDTITVGTYTLTYIANDNAGNTATVIRTVSVVDTTPPAITLNGETELTLEGGNEYQEQGATAIDIIDGEVEVIISGSVDTIMVGTYTLTYIANDSAGNTAMATRTVSIVDTTPPVITLNGEREVILEAGFDYEELGANAFDNLDGQLEVLATGTVNEFVTGFYVIEYTAVDKAGNRAITHRDILVFDTIAPTITLNGQKHVEVFLGDDYEELGSKAVDSIDGEVNVDITGEVETDALGEYILTYTASDLSGNSASAQRIVSVITKPFITRWVLPSEHLGVTLLANPNYDYEYTIDWGDGHIDTNQKSHASHTYEVEGEYLISINGKFPHFQLRKEAMGIYQVCQSCTSIRSVVQWGDIEWRDMTKAFYEQKMFTHIESDTPPNLTNVTSLSQMFAYTNFNDDISHWDVSNVSNMSSMFRNSQFVGDISKWNTSNLTDMSYMFASNSLSSPHPFNGDISLWNISNVLNLEGLFYGSQFNGDISQWDVSSVTNMSFLFYDSDFNGDVSKWNVSSVILMNSMFSGSYQRRNIFDSDLSQWNVSKVTDMGKMFFRSNFNGDISQWNVSNVVNMNSMFFKSSFDGDISQWDVSNVKYMSNMFRTTVFNGDLSQWNVSKVEKMNGMFKRSEFNGDISQWDVSSVIDMNSMFAGIYMDHTLFNGDLSLWDVSSVTDMSHMFYRSAFSGDISPWNVVNVKDMSSMFADTNFNGDISNWDVSQVSNMERMFARSKFNGDLSLWDVGNVTNMRGMFSGSSDTLNPFNSNISQWNVSRVKDMSSMFYGTQFNQDISQWNVGNVTNMYLMFAKSKYDRDISQWDVSAVTSMKQMFQESRFSGDISDWDVSNVTDMRLMFYKGNFNGDISKWDVSKVSDMWEFIGWNYYFSKENYDALLNAWSQLDLKKNVQFGVDQYYSEHGAGGRNILIDVFNWDIEDKGLQPNSQNISEAMH